jgi:peroxin-16
MEEHLARYATWVKRHGDDARRLEDILRLISMLVPGQFGGVKSNTSKSVLGEVLYSLTNVLTLTHDLILSGGTEGRKVPGSVVPLRMALSVLSSVDIVVEVASLRLGGRRSRWQAICLVEVLRAVLKTVVLARSCERHLVHGGQFSVDTQSPPPTQPDGWWQGGLTGITLPLPQRWSATAAAHGPAVESTASALGLLWTGMSALVLLQESRSTPSTFVSACGGGKAASDGENVSSVGVPCEHHARPFRVLGELLHIWRPVIYALLRLWLGGGSWLPLLASAITDASSARLTTMAAEIATGSLASFIPAETALAVRTTWSQLAVAWKNVSASFSTGGESHADLEVTGGSDNLKPPLLMRHAALSNPPGGSADGALLIALNAPSAGLAGVAIRTALWLFASPPGLTPLEEAELQRRRMQWALYLLRSPIFYAFTKPVADGVVRTASYVPILGSLVAYGHSVLLYLQAHHMYTSASQG